MEETIIYYQKNKEKFFEDYLGSDPNERQYLYNDWIREFFESSD